MRWSPFFGFEAGYPDASNYLEKWRNSYIPIGVHYISKSGFDFVVDVGPWFTHEVTDYPVFVMASVEVGYRFSFKN